MGLGITAYEHAEFVGEASEDYDWNEGETELYDQDPFEAQRDGLENGIYRVSGARIDFGGSYGGYNNFRDKLSWVFMGVSQDTVSQFTDLYKDKPGFQLIYFFDNEGCIGPKTSSALAEVFALYHDAFMASLRVDDWDRKRYEDFFAAFKLASPNGFVRFH